MFFQGGQHLVEHPLEVRLRGGVAGSGHFSDRLVVPLNHRREHFTVAESGKHLVAVATLFALDILGNHSFLKYILFRFLIFCGTNDVYTLVR